MKLGGIYLFIAFCCRLMYNISIPFPVCLLWLYKLFKIFSTLSLSLPVFLFSRCLVTFSVIQSSMNDWQEQARGNRDILPAHTHSKSTNLSRESPRTQSEGHFIISFHLWLDTDLILPRKHKGRNNAMYTHLLVAQCHSSFGDSHVQLKRKKRGCKPVVQVQVIRYFSAVLVTKGFFVQFGNKARAGKI